MGKGFHYKSSFQNDFVGKEEKDELIENGTPFEITKVRFSDKGEYGAQFYLSVRFIDGTEKTMTFGADGTVFTRDDLLEQLQGYLKENPGESVIARLKQEGQTKLIEIEQDEEEDEKK
jgi:hypothetical protein